MLRIRVVLPEPAKPVIIVMRVRVGGWGVGVVILSVLGILFSVIF